MWFEFQRCDPDQEGPSSLVHEAELPATPDAVFAVLADEAPWPEWFPGMRRSTWLTPEPHGVGSLRRVDLAMTGRASLPGTISAVEHFVAFDEPAGPGDPGRMTFYLARATAPLASHFLEDYVLTPTIGGGTRLRWSVHYRVHLPVRPLHPLLRLHFDGMFAQGIRNLAAWLAQPADRPAAGSGG